MSTANDRLSRLLSLVPYLLARPGVAVTTAAADFEVSPKQLRKDLELLWMCGLPGYGPGDLIDLAFDGDLVSVTYDAGMRRPLRLTNAEATALLVALRAFAETPGVADAEAVHRAIVKIEEAAGSARPPGIVIGDTIQEDPDTARTRELARSALDTGRAVWLRYYTASRDALSERTVDPMRVVIVQAVGYLEAWCRSAAGVRLFRLDRIDELVVLEEPAVLPSDAEPTDVSAGVFPPRPDQPAAELVLDQAARWVAEYYSCEELAEFGDGRLRVRMRYGDESWIVRLVLELGGSAVVARPAWLADAVRQRAADAVVMASRRHELLE